MEPSLRFYPEVGLSGQLLYRRWTRREHHDPNEIVFVERPIHKYPMMEVLGLNTSAELVHFALKHGIAAI